MIELYIDDLLAFFNKGGFVLYIVFAIALFLWTLLIERYIYITFEYKKYKKRVFEEIKQIKSSNPFKDEIKRHLVQ